MRGSWTGMPQFPTWLGKHSKTGKAARQLNELKAHMRLNVSGSTKDLMLDYMTPLVGALTRPLLTKDTEGVPDVIKVLTEYDLLKEDMEAILELNTWPGKPDPMSSVPSKTKAALTRTYNKESHMTPYAVDTVVKKKKAKSTVDLEYEDGPLGEEDAIDDDSEDEAPVAKVAKKTAAKETTGKGKATAKNAGGAKGKGRGGKAK